MKPKVLIADDQPEIARLLYLTLEPLEVELLEAGDSDTALRLAVENAPDVAILDVMMPGNFDGLEVCRRIKGDASLRNCYVVLLTARGQQADLSAGQAAGADAYVVKPFSPLTLINMVEAALDERRQ
jgi:CheY-like chemotaxis protein